MLYRAVAILIVAFWVTMTGLLVRKELAPDATAFREVPVGHVMKLMFVHEQASDLQISHERRRLGQLQIQPLMHRDTGARSIDLGGNLQLAFPGVPRQRVVWRGTMELNRALELQTARLNLAFREPATYSIDVTLDPIAQRLRYETRSGEHALDQGDYALDESGAQEWLREQGIDPALMAQFHRPGGPAPTIRAWQSSLEVEGQKLDAYRVAIEHRGQTLLEFHVDHLGHVLQATTFLGYSASATEHTP